MLIERDTPIEDIVVVPGAVAYLARRNVRCLRCGEPIWGTLAEAALEKGYDEEDIDTFVRELNLMANVGRA